MLGLEIQLTGQLWPWLIGVLGGILFGWMVAALIAGTRRGRIEEQLNAESRRSAELEARLMQANSVAE
ncbi:MAG: hypothetical protein ACPG4K_14435, partial [Haloferula sp.]